MKHGNKKLIMNKIVREIEWCALRRAAENQNQAVPSSTVNLLEIFWMASKMSDECKNAKLTGNEITSLVFT